jgi:hypothetical protein
VIEHNRLEVEATGERHFLREFGLLESALARQEISTALEKTTSLRWR